MLAQSKRRKGAQSKKSKRKRERRNRYLRLRYFFEIAETKDPNRRWLKQIVANFLNPDSTKIQYNMDDIVKLLDQALVDITIQPTLLEFEAPTFVCGDIHGQITDLRRIFHICGYPSTKRFLFLGDYVDRGAHSIEVICVLFALRLLFKNNVYLLRGNHELAHINKSYGFMEDINVRWASDLPKAKELYRKFNEVFSFLPLAAVVSNKILCMHGGLSPSLNSLDDIRRLERPITTPKGLAQDILWADPQHGVQGFKHNSMRACSFNFGEKDVEERLKKMGLSKMIRAHQVVQFGWEAFANGRVITVFSASRYQEELYNYAAIIDIQKNLRMEIMMIKPADFEETLNGVVKDELTKDDPQTPSTKSEDEKSLRGKSERGKTFEEKDD
ncbi:hypothetical protein PFISCL1PPCAC_29103 [Pristionchus fissidentatus]|uniref:Serine/threonine-protein phosphatase n=1 Tax=Pristionchus fissidentatus TaxID=1538716 RepID=A0AAV5X2K9_9BILA|nr:hypothetical protein PFISCL1PPCAC_5911 [Pristionchus fissidentatus]GMT37806.1 hypothetical protein PFISCL1PPCAC_29103 [Pristionchus fissidentatus]